MFDVLLRNAEIIDPSQEMHGKGSVAVKDGKITWIGKTIPDIGAKKIFDMEGKIIAPGLIDIHCHPAAGFTWIGVPADEVGLNTGVTLLCDAGSSGAANFKTLRRFIVEPSKTDILCFLNLSNSGLIKLPEIRDEGDIDVDACREVVESNRDVIKGIKIRAVQSLAERMGVRGIEVAKKLASNLGLPLMVHIGEARPRTPNDPMDRFSRDVISLLGSGDIISHYLTWEAGGLILKDGTIFPELEEARKRGVLLDSCHGLYHFNFTIARYAISAGFIPNVISTDMSSAGILVVQSLAVVMSKFLNMGLNIDQVIEMTTINPARALGEENTRGSLKVGMRADITIMELVQGDYVFSDGKGSETMHGKKLLEPRMVFRAGEAMPAYSGYHIPPIVSH